MPQHLEKFEVIIVGGSYAGLSAALILGRSLRKVLVVDSGQARNQPTFHAHSFLTRDGEKPAVLAALARQQAEYYPTVSILEGRVVRAKSENDLIWVETAAGEQFLTRKILLATGVTDEMPALPGFRECWGKSILHCPYCHGYEVANQRIGLFGNGDLGFEMVKLISNWSKQLTLFTDGPAQFLTEHKALIDKHKFPIITEKIHEIEHQEGMLHAVLLADGTRYELDAIFARVPFHQHSDLARQLGCTHQENGLLQCDEFGSTGVPNVYAAGDMTMLLQQVVLAAGSGLKAGAAINRELIEADFH